MPRKRKPVLVKQVVEKVLKKLKSGDKERIRNFWKEKAGEELSKHTMPVSLRKGRLTVEAENSGWLYEATVRHKIRMLKELQGFLGENKIKEIRFRLGKAE